MSTAKYEGRLNPDCLAHLEKRIEDLEAEVRLLKARTDRPPGPPPAFTRKPNGAAGR